MAKRKTQKKLTTTIKTTRARPRTAPLPGMEDHAIKPLEDLAINYAEIRDARIDLNEREHVLKLAAIKLMKRYEKTVYRHNGVEITVIPGEDDVKVKVKRTRDDDDDDRDLDTDGDTIDITSEPMQSDERREAVDDEHAIEERNTRIAHRGRD
jgi:hypothetical protein